MSILAESTLKSLTLTGEYFFSSSQAIEFFKTKHDWESLNFSEVFIPLSLPVLEVLRCCQNLTTFNVPFTLDLYDINGEQLTSTVIAKTITYMSKLQSLELYNAPMYPEDIETICKYCPFLTSLKVYEIEGNFDAWATILLKSKQQWKHLNLFPANASIQTIQRLCTIPTLQSLKIRLENDAGLDWHAMLEKLKISYPNITIQIQ